MEQDLNRISDVMQCPLVYNCGAISGKASLNYEPLPGLSIPVAIDAKKLSHNEQTSVVFHVVGHLWVLVGFYARTNALTLFLIDAAKCELEGVMIAPDKLVSKLNSLKETVDALRPSIVKSFLWKGTAWEKFTLPR